MQNLNSIILILSGKLSTINKLKKIKNKYPDSLCLIGIINGKNYKKKISTSPEIWEYSGEELFNLVFTSKDYYQIVNNCIIDSLKIWIEEYKNKKYKKINRTKKTSKIIKEYDIDINKNSNENSNKNSNKNSNENSNENSKKVKKNKSTKK